MTKPSIDVLVGVHNASRFLRETLDALASQTYPNYRVLISDDCSTDTSFDIARDYARHHSHFLVTRQMTNLGWMSNLNSLLEQASADYTCFVSHDDLVDPEYLSCLAHALYQDPQSVLAYADMVDFYPDGLERPRSAPFLASKNRMERVASLLSSREFWWAAYRGIVRRNIAQALPLKPNWAGQYKGDQTWLLSIAMEGSFAHVNRPLYKKRIHPGSVSNLWHYHAWNDLMILLAMLGIVYRSRCQIAEKARSTGIVLGILWNFFQSSCRRRQH
ncbi:MAG: glycosyltransferase [Blastochloris sp.]|nr:glycosyltransferase [Blastochloris sp.]